MFLCGNHLIHIIPISLAVSLLWAAQKLNLSSSPHRRKRHSSGEDEPSGPPVTFRTDYGGVIHKSPPPVPPALLRRIGVREVSGVGKNIKHWYYAEFIAYQSQQ
ncbi:hypothetical protein J437_LFUL007388 [Ladona fulva]|uniref:Uncharacterized protein n=1 Tax=Ladona fulva TaxID=123851 RepID=A0A8K0P8X0_LADFU|nr:hypothetical protein J437_LFUL007388 [Ladona fulva]